MLLYILRDVFIIDLHYLGFNMGVSINESFKAQLINLVPSLAPDITLFNSNFVSINDADGAPAFPS